MLQFHIRKKIWRAVGLVAVFAVCFLMALVSDVRRMDDAKPAVAEISEDQLTTKVESAKKPNVIVLLSEAFWDPTLLNVEFSQDPIPFFRSLREKFPGGWMLSPMHGGGTANVEFEVLTGNSIRFLNKWNIAYEKNVTHPIESLATILNKQGYTSTAISPATHYIFNSSEVYNRLGFSQFISQEFFPRDFTGPYISDRAVVKQIIDKTTATSEPDFIFANTMENHYHYYPGKFKSNTIKVKSEMPGGSAGIVETLAQGLSGADHALQELVAHYAASDEPTIILFFGDHQPSLEKDYKVYREAGYLKDNDPEEWWKMYSTPFVMWDNFLPMNKQDWKMNASFLLPTLLEHAGIKGTPYTDFLLDLSKRMPIVPPDDANASIPIDGVAMAHYKQLQEQMLAEILPLTQPYVLGYTNFKVEQASIENRTLTVKGQGFGIGSAVMVNGEKLVTTWKDMNTLTAAVPPSMSNSVSPWTVQVKVYDDQQIEIAHTADFTFNR
ncbi:sulfatase-like hydrolase/transferase [Paenibacillus sp. N1-5-1-14]|uniref:sulfatase-like hydrolase/transferase n=1 Tax=Paenibacillus radicibacter TaxID=2972488 RepID=UPI002158C69A|nr:sulfatase-like hydrolase/transferase [Paenibacillus radicibacter]MCR8643252.1 sulfatase-like hydrolase/transferase [Paenibacillus radicibacter]